MSECTLFAPRAHPNYRSSGCRSRVCFALQLGQLTVPGGRRRDATASLGRLADGSARKSHHARNSWALALRDIIDRSETKLRVHMRSVHVLYWFSVAWLACFLAQLLAVHLFLLIRLPW